MSQSGKKRTWEKSGDGDSKRIRKKKTTSLARRHQGVPQPLNKKGQTKKEAAEDQGDREEDLQEVRKAAIKKRKKGKGLDAVKAAEKDEVEQQEEQGEGDDSESDFSGLSGDELDEKDAEEAPALGSAAVAQHSTAAQAKLKAVQARIARAKKAQQAKQPLAEATGAVEGRGVLYLGHLPFGFFEQEMQGFFSQFGRITRLRLSRNKKTGKSKHYAFLEFDSPEVAQIVADAFDRYMMFDRVIRCQVVPPSKVHAKLFVGAGQTFIKTPRQHELQRTNKPRTAAEQVKRVSRLLGKEEARRLRLKAAGIEYDFPGYAAEAKGASGTRVVLED